MEIFYKSVTFMYLDHYSMSLTILDISYKWNHTIFSSVTDISLNIHSPSSSMLLHLARFSFP